MFCERFKLSLHVPERVVAGAVLTTFATRWRKRVPCTRWTWLFCCRWRKEPAQGQPAGKPYRCCSRSLPLRACSNSERSASPGAPTARSVRRESRVWKLRGMLLSRREQGAREHHRHHAASVRKTPAQHVAVLWPSTSLGYVGLGSTPVEPHCPVPDPDGIANGPSWMAQRKEYSFWGFASPV